MPSLSPRMRHGLILVLAAGSVAAAGLYSLLPFSYAYFGNTPYFRYFPGELGKSVRRTSIAGLYERAWAVPPKDQFQDGDITCQFSPAVLTSGCERTLEPGFFASGPSRVLPMGTYQATIQLDAPKGCSGAVQVDAISGDFGIVLAETEIQMGPASTKSAQIEFVIDRVLADRAKIDVRVRQLSSPPCAVLKRVDLVRRFL